MRPETADGGGSPQDRDWTAQAVQQIEADFARSADTHLVRLDLPRLSAAGVDLYLKDESTHPSGSLKHRLARSLFLYGLCNGWVRPGRPVIECSSGSTAISESYFARLIGVPFIAVAPRGTAQPKLDAIAFHGGEVRLVPPSAIYDEARGIADFDRRPFHGPVHLRRARDRLARQQQHRGEPFSRWRLERHPRAGLGGGQRRNGRHVPRPSAGTSAIASTARRTPGCASSIPSGSAFFDAVPRRRLDAQGRRELPDRGHRPAPGGASFLPSVVDRMVARAGRRLDRDHPLAGDAHRGANAAARPARTCTAPCCSRRR